MAITREDMLKTWDNAWTKGLWHAPWSKVLDGLTPEQVTWIPATAKHSIWQIVDHVMYWRDVAIRRALGQKVSDDEMTERNFRPTPSPSKQVLEELRTRFAASHQQFRDAIAVGSSDLEKLEPLPFHDSYHIGQVMLLRAMQGLEPID